jgi:hypothetical protein
MSDERNPRAVDPNAAAFLRLYGELIDAGKVKTVPVSEAKRRVAEALAKARADAEKLWGPPTP